MSVRFGLARHSVFHFRVWMFGCEVVVEFFASLLIRSNLSKIPVEDPLVSA